MKVLYLDCFAGVSGDMLLGAMMDLGVTVQALSERLEGLGLSGYNLSAKKTVKVGIASTKASVDLVRPEHTHRHLPDILDIITGSSLPRKVQEQSAAVFTALAAAEGKVHGIPAAEVHFHEVGAVDAIVDIVGTVTALDLLGVEQVFCSRLPLGSGFVQCAHGTLPLPAPATMEILRDVPTTACEIIGETVTPTGAALVKTLASGFGPMPAMRIQAVGYGAGQADRKIPNVLRAVLGEALEQALHSDLSAVQDVEAEALFEDSLTVIETNIDNMNPEFYEHIISLLFAAGAVDAFVTPVIMKKSRPGQVLSCLAPRENQSVIINTMLRETSSLGVRTYPCHRYKLDRDIIPVRTDYGIVHVKIGRYPGRRDIINFAPEWEDCKTLALKHKLPVKIIYDLAKVEAYTAIKP